MHSKHFSTFHHWRINRQAFDFLESEFFKSDETSKLSRNRNVTRTRKCSLAVFPSKFYVAQINKSILSDAGAVLGTYQHVSLIIGYVVNTRKIIWHISLGHGWQRGSVLARNKCGFPEQTVTTAARSYCTNHSWLHVLAVTQNENPFMLVLQEPRKTNRPTSILLCKTPTPGNFRSLAIDKYNQNVKELELTKFTYDSASFLSMSSLLVERTICKMALNVSTVTKAGKQIIITLYPLSPLFKDGQIKAILECVIKFLC